MAYYLKYRPQKVKDLDLEAVRKALGEILASKNIPHAFLFVGPKGTGKTSSARIVAKSVNCTNKKKDGEPCNKCETCKLFGSGRSMDLIEIDAASNRGIDDIRELRDKINLTPSQAEHKVYIIDEVHMLTTEAFNALLKTLEEPPRHAKFVLCTTEPQKIPGTIVSRCTEIQFKKATGKEVLRSLNKVVKGEKLKVKKEDLEMIAKSADGSFRDAVKVLEQLAASGKKISSKKAKELLEKGLTADQLDDWLVMVYQKQTKKALDWLKVSLEAGMDMRRLVVEAVERLRLALFHELGLEEGVKLAEANDVNLLKSLIKVLIQAGRETRGAVVESLPLELAVVEWCQQGETRSEEKPNLPISRVKRSAPVEKTKKLETRSGKLELNEVISKWSEIMEAIKPHNHSLEALLRATKPSGFDGESLILEVFYKFHKERLEVDRYRKIVEEVASKVLVAPIRIKFFLSQQTQKVVAKQAEDDNLSGEVEDDIIKTAEKVFGVEVS